MARPSPPGSGSVVDLAVVLEPLAGGDRPGRSRSSPGCAARAVEADAVPALHHLRAAGADAEHEPAARQRLQRQRRHGEHRRRAGAELHDAGGEPDGRGRARRGRPSGVSASAAQNSGTHTESTPSRSASRTSSTPAGAVGMAPMPTRSVTARSASCLMPSRVRSHVRARLLEPASDDPLLLVGHRLDRDRQPGRSRSHPHALAEAHAVAFRRELEPPARRRVVRVAHVPLERPVRLVPGDERGRLHSPIAGWKLRPTKRAPPPPTSPAAARTRSGPAARCR